MTTIDDVISDQSDLNTKYSNYTVAYLQYIDCLNTGSSLCSTTSLDASYAGLSSAIKTEQGHVDSVYSVYSGNIVTDASYSTLTDLRSNLDLKLQALYNKQNSIPQLYNQQFDSTIYTGVLWTVLATTLIYYVFIKL